MAKQRNAEEKQNPLDRIAVLLALLLIKGVDKDDAALQLDIAGFSALEISKMLNVNENYIHALKNKLKTSNRSKARS